MAVKIISFFDQVSGSLGGEFNTDVRKAVEMEREEGAGGSVSPLTSGGLALVPSQIILVPVETHPGPAFFAHCTNR